MRAVIDKLGHQPDIVPIAQSVNAKYVSVNSELKSITTQVYVIFVRRIKEKEIREKQKKGLFYDYSFNSNLDYFRSILSCFFKTHD